MALFTKEEREEMKEIQRELRAEGVDENVAAKEAAKEVAEGVSDERKEADPALQALQDQQEQTAKTLEKVTEYIEAQPSIKNVGYFTQDGGEADKDSKSFGDFLLAVKRGDRKRLSSIYKSVPQAWADCKGTPIGDGGPVHQRHRDL